MYRLINNKQFSHKNFKILTSTTTTLSNKKFLWTPCCGCNFKQTNSVTQKNIQYFPINQQNNCYEFKLNNFSIYPNIRSQSTTPLNIEQILQIRLKKKRFRNKKFAELLEVNDGSYLQTKASVQKLKSKQLTAFINKSNALNNFSTSTIYKIKSHSHNETNQQLIEPPIIFIENPNFKLNKESKQIADIIESYKTFKKSYEIDQYLDEPNIALNKKSPTTDDGLIEFLPKNSEEICDTKYVDDEHEIDAIAEDEHLNVIEQEDIHVDCVKKTKTKKKTQLHIKPNQYKTLEHEKLAKKQSITTILIAYLEMCVQKSMTNRGLSVLLHYRTRYRQMDIKLDNIKLYNILMIGYAEKGNLHKIKEILAILKSDNIPLIPQTYALIFECIGRLPSTDSNQKLLVHYKNAAKVFGISLNDIIDKSKFLFDQQEIVLSAIKSIEPDFKPVYTPPKLTYSNELLSRLNENVKSPDFIFNNNKNYNYLPGTEIMESKRGFTLNEYEKFTNDQLEIELNGSVTIKSIQKFNDINDTVLDYRNKLKDLHQKWRDDICIAFNRDFCSLRSHSQLRTNLSVNILPYLKALTVDQYTDIILQEVRQLAEGSEMFSLSVGQLYRSLGQKVYSKYQLEQKKRNGFLEKIDNIYHLYCETFSKCNSTDNPRQCWQRYSYQCRNYGASMDIAETHWPMSIKISIGRFLYQILLRDLKLDVNLIRVKKLKSENYLPAFYTLFRNQGKLIKEDVKPHPVLVKLYRCAQQDTLTFDANLVPMLCPPQPWHTPNNGGYLLANSDLLRLPTHAHQQMVRIKELPESDLYPALDSLNQLASIPWCVNKSVLDVILKVFNDGGSKKLDVPEPPSALQSPQVPNKVELDKLTKQEKFEILKEKMNHKRQQAEMYSLWCDALYRLSLANHYRDRVFWLPHNMDFRGRVYPIPPHLNHLGDDLARSLLIFNQKKKLGPNGFYWLKLHCINLTGFKKRESVDERLQYADEIMPEILDSADNPLTGRMWWSKSDEPWQTLACCMEIAQVMRSDNPETFVSGFPIHQDGSCNGLQHYAALGRDMAGARSVNLVPLNVPQDVYSNVAGLVEEQRQKDANLNIKVAQILNGFVKRKVIKQTVMTTVYGVTRYGARLQIARQLKDIDEFPKDWIWPASLYLTTKTFDCLREMFTSTKEIQDWFTDCARLISAVGGQHVEWVTPLGLPIVQPYNRPDKKLLPKTNKIQENCANDSYDRPNVLKQKNAFPPNFIHSLDSSHMMLTGLNCEKLGLTFMSVHDCFWTHPCTVAEMNRVCREQFVALHSQPILENLSTFLADKYSYDEKNITNDGTIIETTKRKLNRLLIQIPPKGTFELNEILKSTYFFS